ncbi:MAG: DegT/DnrJ/EryC1/StrS family aminotransferase [Gaiellaceae bacterium]
MPIRVWDYLEEYADERDEILAAVDQVFSSGRLILGESVQRFEAAFSSYCGVRHGVGVDNGTNAIFLALKALDIGAGDEVLTVSNTAVPTVSAIVSAGATPRFVDIDPSTYLIDPSRIEPAITPQTRCILPVHLYGQCADMDALQAIASKHGLAVVEDCAQSHGATNRGHRAGSMSDAAAFSFYPTKPLGAYGDGGMVVTSRDDVDKSLRRLRFYGMDDVYYAEEHGYNSRLDEVQAEILYRRLSRLDGYIAARRRLAARYHELLADLPLVLPVTGEGNEHVYYLFVVRCEERDRVIAKLKERDIHLNVSYPWPIHTMRGYAYLGYSAGDLPESERAASEVLSLPMYPTLADEDQLRVCEALTDVLS